MPDPLGTALGKENTLTRCYCPTREAPATVGAPSFTERVEHLGTKQRI